MSTQDSGQDSTNDFSTIEFGDGDFQFDFDQIERVVNAFFEESKIVFENLEEQIIDLEENPDDEKRINSIFRKIHTLKGSVGAVPGGQLVGSLSHEFEALLNRIRREQLSVTKECIDLFLQTTRILKVLIQGLKEKREIYPEELSESIELISRYGSFVLPKSGKVTTKNMLAARSNSEEVHEDQGVWLSTDQMNEILRVSGELLVLKNLHNNLRNTLNYKDQPEVFERRQDQFSYQLEKICDQLSGQVQTVRKTKASEIFDGLNLLVRQASTELNKMVQIELRGMDLMIDKVLGKELLDCVTHLARNSVDHGIEDQFERTLAGKSSIGTLTLEVKEANGIVFLEFRDDGAGLNRDRILQKAIAAGLVSSENKDSLSDDEIFKFIFSAGFSTKEKITTISGRGIGMDVVQSKVEKYGGQIAIESTLGQGTCFKIQVAIPRVVSVESTLLAGWKDLNFAIPLKSVARIGSCRDLELNQINNLRHCQFEGQTVPLLNYQELLQETNAENENVIRKSSVIFLRQGLSYIGLVVDKINSQTDLVVKGFAKMIGQQKGFNGISILSDEQIAYVIDSDSIFDMIKRSYELEAA